MAASEILARVEALDKKAAAADKSGQVLRAAEYLGRSAEAARELGPDNVVALQQQLYQSNKLGAYSISAFAVGAGAGADAGSVHPSAQAAHRAQCVALLVDAAEALERRRTAGTLLEGKCSAAEEAWWRLVHKQSPSSQTYASFVGYDTFMTAAAFAAKTLGALFVFEAELSQAHLRTFAGLAVRAAHLMQQPRRRGFDGAMGCEALFLDALRTCVEDCGENGLEPPLVQLLTGTLQQLERSGVAQARPIDQLITSAAHAALQSKRAVATLKSLLASDLRCCALASCGVKEAHSGHYKSCAACRTVVYCSQEHHVADWPAHKAACKAARKAAAGEAAPAEQAEPSDA